MARSITYLITLVSTKPFDVSGKQCCIPRFEMLVNLRATPDVDLSYTNLKMFPLHLASAIMDEELCRCHTAKPPLCNYDIEATYSRHIVIAGGTGAK